MSENENKNEDKKQKNPHYFRDLADSFLHDCARRNCPIRYWQRRVLMYDGTRYVEEYELAQVVRKFLLDTNVPVNNNIVSNVVPIIHARTKLKTKAEASLPLWLNSGRRPANIIAFRNGLLDVATNELLPHTPKWISLVCLPYDYDPTAKCPQWLNFLQDRLDGDAQRIALLQEFFGYCMVPDNSMQKLLLLIGPSRCGKGTTTTILENVIGAENTAGYHMTSLAEHFGLCGLVGKLVATIGEVKLEKSRDKYQILERLNSIVGNDPQHIDYKNDPIKLNIRLLVRFVISCNEMPHFADDSGALAERLLIVNYFTSVPEKDRDPYLADTLKLEVSGIANWALAGLCRLRETSRFTASDIMKATLSEVRRRNSPAFAFCQDRLIVHPRLDTGNLPGVTVEDFDYEQEALFMEDAMREYHAWLAEHSHHEGNINYLYANLKAILPKLKRAQRSRMHERKWVMLGLKLAPIQA